MAPADLIEPIYPYPLPEDVRNSLLELASESDLLVLGEMHGCQEVPRLILGLLDDRSARGYRSLALEIPHNQHQQLAEWAGGESSEPPTLFGHAESRDGRGNLQVVSLIRQMFAQHPDWHLFCFDLGRDQTGMDWAGRDASMAANLVQQWKTFGLDNKVLAVCGNLHSRLALMPGVLEDCWPSFAYNVQQHLPQANVRSVNVVFHGGTFFNCEIKQFNPQSPPLIGEGEVRADDWLGHTRALHLPEATHVTFLKASE